MNDKTLIIGAILVAVGGIALAGGSRALSGTGAGSGGHVASAAAVQEIAPDFTLEKLGGGSISLSEYRGKKSVILDFFATWCPNCRRDLPHVNEFYRKYKDQVEVIGLNLQENPQTVAQFVRDFGLEFPVALDPRSQAVQSYGVQYTNYHVLIDKGGTIVRVVPGDIRESDFQALL